jgi:maltose alpha-D-glucosyltransferase/alpha-amylase
MQWDDGRAGGFSTAPVPELAQPVSTRGPYGVKHVNVRSQRRDRSSLLRWFEELIRVLRECPEIGVGVPSVVDIPLPRSVLAHRFDAPEGSILLLHNLSERAALVDLSPVDLGSDPHEVWASTPAEMEPGEPKVRLPGYGYRWIRL